MVILMTFVCALKTVSLLSRTFISISMDLSDHHHHQSELVGDVAVPVSVRQAVLF